MPEPRSRTSSAQPPRAGFTATSTCSPVDPASAAFFSRLIMTCSSCDSSNQPGSVGMHAVHGKRRHGLQRLQERPPAHLGAPRPRQLGEARVIVDELRQVRHAVVDGREHALQLRRVGLQHEPLPRLRQRGDRRDGIVDLVRDHADHFFPDRDFLRIHFARQLLQQPQAMRLAVQQELALRDVKNLRVAVQLGREQAVVRCAHAPRAASRASARAAAPAQGPRVCGRRRTAAVPRGCAYRIVPVALVSTSASGEAWITVSSSSSR